MMLSNRLINYQVKYNSCFFCSDRSSVTFSGCWMSSVWGV